MTTATAARGKRVATLRPSARPSREQRVARGKAARTEVPRSSHAEFTPAPQRPDPVALLESQAATRVPELLPIRYGRMAVSAFTFFRGAALPMAQRPGRHPALRVRRAGLRRRPPGQLRAVRLPGATPRLRHQRLRRDPARSVGMGRQAPGGEPGDRRRGTTSSPTKERRGIVLGDGRRLPQGDAGVRRADRARGLVRPCRPRRRSRRGSHPSWTRPASRKTLARTMAKARTKDNLGALGRFAGVRRRQPRIIADPPLIVPLQELFGRADRAGEVERGSLRGILHAYRATLEPERRVLLDQYRARRTSPARSSASAAWAPARGWRCCSGTMCRTRCSCRRRRPGPRCWRQFVGPSEYDNCGQRVVVGQRLMQAVSDIFLGWVRVKGFDGQTRDFYLRQLRDWKGSAEIESMVPAGMRAYGELCGWTLARAHARSGDRDRHRGLSRRGPGLRRRPYASSPRPTPTRTSATIGCWSTRSPRAGSPRLRMCRTLGVAPLECQVADLRSARITLAG